MNQRKNDRPLSDKQARNQLFNVLHSNLPRKQALKKVLDIGSDYLGIDHGHITDIDRADDRWEVIGSTDPPDGPYPDGLTVKLSDSYCRRTMEQPTPLALHDAKNQGWAEDHAYQLHQLDTYLGLRIEAFDEPYGTICFVQSGAREKPFSEIERIFIELAGQVLRKVLEESYYQKDLANRDRLISVLNRVLRHNLRNDLNVVQGHAEILQERTSDEMADMASTIHTTATGLLSLAEKSRQLNELTSSVPVARPMDIVPIVEGTVTEIREEYPSVDISIDAPDQAMTFAAPQLSVALEELLENAAMHSGIDPKVDVGIAVETDQVTVHVVDDGPGLPNDERRVLAGTDETVLEHGSGLGLAVIVWIITNLDGEINVSASSSGTTVKLHLRRAGSIGSGSN